LIPRNAREKDGDESSNRYERSLGVTQKQTTRERKHMTEITSETKSPMWKAATLKDKMDQVIDDIDKAIEENKFYTEEYVQRGGE
jgi:hypothetical protein